jgi:hypothetical protein
MSFKFNDERRLEMARAGFEVAQIIVDRTTHKVTAILYAYQPCEAAEWLERVTPPEPSTSRLKPCRRPGRADRPPARS